MARITYGPLVTEIAGSIGGVTFQRNTSGPIAKLKTNPPVNPRTEQSAYQIQLAYLVSLWPTLSQEDKDLWNAHAIAHDHTTPWGETKTLSGYQWFLSCNILRLHYHSSPILVPGAWTSYSPIAQFTIEITDTYIRAAWDPPASFAHILGYVTLPLKQSSLKLRRSLFFRGYKVSGSPITNWDLTSFIENLYNVTWSTFFYHSDCNIVIRIRNGSVTTGYFSAFTSAIIKIS